MALAERARGVRGDLGVKAPCRVATTANITLSGEQTIDGVAVVADDRVLVKNQTTSSENGIWEASTGAWTRAPDFDGAGDVVTGTLALVNLGTVNSGYAFVVTTTGTITPGTTSITFGPASFGASAAAAVAAAAAAAASEAVAAASASSASTSYDTFDDRYLGVKAANPTLDNDGNALVQGALYYNNVAFEMRVWSGAVWGSLATGAAAGITYTPAADIAATDVQAALTELGNEKANKAVANTFSKAQVVSPVALTLSASNLNTDASESNEFTHTTTADFVMVNPTNLVAGGEYAWHFTQGATPRVISSYGALFKFAYGVAGVLTASASAKDTLSCKYDGAILRCIMLPGFA